MKAKSTESYSGNTNFSAEFEFSANILKVNIVVLQLVCLSIG